MNTRHDSWQERPTRWPAEHADMVPPIRGIRAESPIILNWRRPGFSTAAARRRIAFFAPIALVLAALLATGCGESDDAAVPSSQQVQAALDEAVDAGAPGIAVRPADRDGDAGRAGVDRF